MVSEFVVVWGELNWLRDVAGWLFRAVGEGGCSGVGWAISASLDSWEERLSLQ